MSCGFSPQIPNFLMSQVRKLNENSNRRYQFYDRRIKNLLRKISTDSREKPDKNSSEVSRFSSAALYESKKQWLVTSVSKKCEIIHFVLTLKS